MIRYRVRATDEPLVYYAGYSFQTASWRFDEERGDRVMERYVDDEWQVIFAYVPGTDERIEQLAASWATKQLRRMRRGRHAPRG